MHLGYFSSFSQPIDISISIYHSNHYNTPLEADLHLISNLVLCLMLSCSKVFLIASTMFLQELFTNTFCDVTFMNQHLEKTYQSPSASEGILELAILSPRNSQRLGTDGSALAQGPLLITGSLPGATSASTMPTFRHRRHALAQGLFVVCTRMPFFWLPHPPFIGPSVTVMIAATITRLRGKSPAKGHVASLPLRRQEHGVLLLRYEETKGTIKEALDRMMLLMPFVPIKTGNLVEMDLSNIRSGIGELHWPSWFCAFLVRQRTSALCVRA